MAETGIEIPITATGGAAAAAEIGKVSSSLGEFRTQAQGLSGAAGALGGALSAISPEANAFGSAIARAGGAIGALTSVIGGGPGVLFGGVVAVLGLLTTAIKSSADEAAAATRATEEHAKALQAQAEAADKARVTLSQLIAVERSRESEAATLARLNAGRGDVAEQRGFLAEIENQINEGNAGRYAVVSPEQRAELNRRRNLLAEAEAQQRAARNNARMAEEFRNEEFLRGGGGIGGGGGGRGSANDNGLESFLSSARDRADFSLSTEGDPREQSTVGVLNARGESIGNLVGQSRGGTSSFAEQSRKDADSVKAAWADAGATAADSMGQAFAALITGGEDAAAAALRQIGERMVGEGSIALFRGGFESLLGNPLGPTMMLIGAAEIAMGLGLGAATQGASVGAGGAARPTPAREQNQGGGDGPTVVNVYALNPTAEVGRLVDKSMRESKRKQVAR